MKKAILLDMTSGIGPRDSSILGKRIIIFKIKIWFKKRADLN